MKKTELQIKLSYVKGLGVIVKNEISHRQEIIIIKQTEDSLYVSFSVELDYFKNLKSVSRVYLVRVANEYNPLFLSKHKSLISEIIEIILIASEKRFKTYSITCAGSGSREVLSISENIKNNFKLIESKEADLKIHIIKNLLGWEIGAQITTRPLSMRKYKILNMSGAMDPTIAYAVNSLCKIENKGSYLNIFSGSATLLIEAGHSYPNLKRVIGFDISKKHLSLGMQNIKEAKLIRRVTLYEKNIIDYPNLGNFDVITSDLPFGMKISKNENLQHLNEVFISYCEQKLNEDGILGVFTNESTIFEKALKKSRFTIIEKIRLTLITSVNSYLYPSIFICKFLK